MAEGEVVVLGQFEEVVGVVAVEPAVALGDGGREFSEVLAAQGPVGPGGAEAGPVGLGPGGGRGERRAQVGP